MRYSNLFTKTTKEAPADESAKNAQLLIRGGFIHKMMAGVYEFLPLGLRVMNKIVGVIREEMNALGGQEVFMTTLQSPEIWKASNRWDNKMVDNWFKSELKAGGEVGLANTHEEPLAKLLTHHISSYKDLPRYIYQFQTKFRNELRAKSGLMRGREFLMKDLYSFTQTEKEFKEFYEKCAQSYLKIFAQVGLGDITFRTFASGGSFSKFSDEFQTLSESGEDTIYLDESKKIAINKEVYNDEVLNELSLKKDSLKECRAIEVGNIFPLGTKYAEAMNLKFRDEEGNEKPVVMGSYGIGVGRLMGTIVEVFNDDKGIIWPEVVAPYKICLIQITANDQLLKTNTDKIYEKLQEAGIEVLYDDRDDKTPGEKFADCDLLGIPYRAVVSKKTGAKIELKKRSSKETQLVTWDELQEIVRG
jgi:prolyl-tRNA synthetase